jgi:hypothetical protein
MQASTAAANKEVRPSAPVAAIAPANISVGIAGTGRPI